MQRTPPSRFPPAPGCFGRLPRWVAALGCRAPADASARNRLATGSRQALTRDKPVRPEDHRTPSFGHELDELRGEAFFAFSPIYYSTKVRRLLQGAGNFNVGQGMALGEWMILCVFTALVLSGGEESRGGRRLGLDTRDDRRRTMDDGTLPSTLRGAGKRTNDEGRRVRDEGRKTKDGE